MHSDPNDRGSSRRNKVAKALSLYQDSEVHKLCSEYYRLLLDQKVNLLIQAVGEEAVTLRGEMRCLKHLLSTFNAGDNPFTDAPVIPEN